MHEVTQRKVEVTYGSSGKLKSSKTIMSLVLVLALAFSSLALAACSSPEPAPASSASAPSETKSVGYKQEFLKVAEAWGDNFVVFVGKFKANPSDPDLLKELESWNNQLGEVSNVGNAIKPYLTGTDAETLARIIGKVNSAIAELNEAKKTTNNTTTTTPQAGSTDYKQFLAEYEAWVDKYVEFMKKYKENPTNLSLLTEYTSLATEQMEWSKKVDDIQGKISGEDLQTLTRITQKLTSALM